MNLMQASLHVLYVLVIYPYLKGYNHAYQFRHTDTGPVKIIGCLIAHTA